MHDVMAIFSLSIVYGFTVCSLACLPTLGVYLMGSGRTFQDGLIGCFYFVAGKMLVYGTWGGLAGGFGMMFGVPAIQSRWIGIFVIVSALALPLAAGTTRSCNCRRAQKYSRKLPLILLGASTSLVPCPPLVAVLLLAAHNGSIVTGIIYGFVFGAGLVVTPIMAAGPSMALIAGVIRQKVSWIGVYLQGGAMLILLVMGLRILFEV